MRLEILLLIFTKIEISQFIHIREVRAEKPGMVRT